jgi:predicted nuclease of predicted toxin-antitoxin system
MRILANENIPADAVVALRERGHDVSWVRTEAPGSSDGEILERARREERVVVTFDKDFGELAFRDRVPSARGIVLSRISAPSSTHVARAVVAALESRTDWAGHFAVVEDDRVRMVTLLASSR